MNIKDVKELIDKLYKDKAMIKWLKFCKLLDRLAHRFLNPVQLRWLAKQKAQESPIELELFDLKEDFLKTAGKMRFMEDSYAHCELLTNDYWMLMRERQNNTVRMAKLIKGEVLHVQK